MSDEYEQKFHEIMGAIKSSRMQHGLCLPVERRACTACAAQRIIDRMLSEWKGPRMILAGQPRDNT